MKLSIALLSIVLACVGIQQVASLAVMSVDFGSEWMKVGIVSPGVPMEIALNKESKRKTPAVISFRDNVRLFGEDAQTVGLRFPKQAYSYLLDLLGKSIDHPLVKLYQERFPYYEIVPDVDRGTILFKQDDDTFFSPEELIAQFLTKAREFAESGAQQPIKECVLTVPGFFNQVERTALLEAAELAGLKVLQLINDYTAVALNYGKLFLFPLFAAWLDVICIRLFIELNNMAQQLLYLCDVVFHSKVYWTSDCYNLLGLSVN